MSLFIPFFARATDANNNPLSLATLTFYQTDTDTLLPVYSDSDLETPHENPLASDSAGLFEPVYYDPSETYRVVLKNAVGTVIDEVDPYNGSSSSSTAAGAAFTPETYGAMGEGDDDTEGLLAMVAAVNAAGSGHIIFAPGKTYLLGNDDGSTMYFLNVDGLYIEGWGATLKTADNGAPIESLGRNWGQITIANSQNVKIHGLTLDGNRDGQEHTADLADGNGFNGGIVFWHPVFPCTTTDVDIRGCRFIDHGVLSGSTDYRGDGIFAVSGPKRMFIEDCVFENCGRWALALAEGADASDHIYFRYNTVTFPDRVDSGIFPWGAIDIEDTGLNHSHLYFDDNTFEGTTQISIGGYSSTVLDVTVSDVSISRNYWLIPDGSNGANVPFTLGTSNPPTGVYRNLERMFIEDNIVIWEGASNTMHVGMTAKLTDVYIRRNLFMAKNPVSDSDNGIALAYGGHIEGRLSITDNVFIGLGEALKADTWYADPSPEPLYFHIERNRFDNCYRAFTLNLTTSVIPTATSKIVIRDNVTENTRDTSGEAVITTSSLNVDYYDISRHDAIWQHVNITYKGTPGVTSTASTAYTLSITELKNPILVMTSGSAITLTVPPNSTMPFPVGTELSVEQNGAGAITATAGVGVTLQGTLTTAAQYQILKLRKTSTNRWSVIRQA